MPGTYRERNSASDRTLDILTMFTEDRPRLSAGELAAELGTARSTAVPPAMPWAPGTPTPSTAHR